MHIPTTATTVKAFFESTAIFTTPIPRREDDKIETKHLIGLNANPPAKTTRPKKCRSFQDRAKTLRNLAAAKNDVRFYLNGLFYNFDAAEIVATDGHRMIIWKPEYGIPENYKARQLPGCKGLIIGHDDKTIDGTYPDYRRVADKAKNGAKHQTYVDVIKILGKLNGIKRAAQFSRQVIGAVVEIDNTQTVFNASYLFDAFAVFARFGMNTVSVSIDDSTSPMYLVADNVEVVLMPMRDDTKAFAPIKL